jgi:uncharacterized membrane protein YgdD (TMEM256/DUF423 family)
MRRWTYGLVALAAFAGAAGVIEAAAVAHGSIDPLAQTSANFLLFAAAAVIAIAAFAQAAPRHRAFFLTAGSLLLAGSLLFCGDLAARAFLAHKLFDFAAPVGGTLMIVGWVAAALAALTAALGGRRPES